MAETEEQKEGAKVADSSTYIRTYAKDMAATAGRATPDKLRAEVQVKPATEESDGVVTQKVDDSYIENQERREGGKGEESLEIPSSADLQSYVTTTAEQPNPEIVAPQLEEPESIAALAEEAVPQTPLPHETREGILARLKRKMGERAQSKAAAQAPRELVPPSAPIEEAPTPLAPPPPAPDPVPDRLHTYSTDFSDRVDSKEASAFSVLAAEVDAPREKRAKVPGAKGSKVLVPILLGIVLIAVGSGGAYAAYRYFHTRTAVPVSVPAIPSLVFADEYKELTGTGAALLANLAATADEPLVADNVLVTYVKVPVASPTGTTTQAAPGGVLIEALDLPAPDILLRNIAPESTVGIIHAGPQTRTFFVLRVDSYERTFAGMLAWESWMAHDLAQLYPLYPSEVVSTTIPAATSTVIVKGKKVATTTPARTIETSMQGIAESSFIDGVVANHDVRLLKDTNGHTLLLYGYVDKQTLLITRDESAFTELLVRLSAKAPQ